ncbi:hypothetical protein B0H17DRAFT_1142574 [Mycena rosella]|uniref:Uncharacterized protein n=1 Tax=Mycena rosella TaxID=1033263 RepID=A0AAD7G971_MYCRO|nr:hypothetical protein B0H17DRAFT_1142574 [Mycena rosella]
MPNATGKNGYGTKNYPSDSELKETLLTYAFTISRTTKLNQIEKRLEILSVRRTPAAQELAAQAISDEVDKDVVQGNGPNYVKSRLKDQLIMVKRNTVRDVMHQLQPLGAEHRFPGNKKKVFRQPLSALGPFHEVSSDGHEKLGQQALKMGILACQFTLTRINGRRTFSNQRISTVQTTTDKGSEVGWLHAIQMALREQFAPDIDPTVYLPNACIESVHNTIIEAFWRWLKLKCGLNFTRTHYKNMPSGHVPANALEHPEFFGGIGCLIKVPQATIQELRVFLTEEVGPREDHMRWVTDDLNALAREVHESLGSPKIMLESSWMVFKNMSDRIEDGHFCIIASTIPLLVLFLTRYSYR